MDQIETLFRHALISLIAIASHEEFAGFYQAPDGMSADDYEELLAELDWMKEVILDKVYDDGEEAICLEDFTSPLLQETKQVFEYCLKHFVYRKLFQ